MSNLILIASAKQQGLNGIGRGPSINKNGLVAFAGTSANGQGLYVGNGKDLFRNINPAFSSDPNRLFGDYVQINDSGKVAARDQEDGSPFQTFVRMWDSQVSNAYTIIAGGGGPSDKFSEVMICPSINNAVSGATGGQVVFGALPESPPYMPVLATPALAPVAGADFNQAVLSGNLLLPRIADNGRIVVSAGDEATSPIWAYAYDLSGVPGDIAGMSGPTPSFSEVGGNPGISGDGQVIAFYGNLTQEAAGAWGLTPGPGIFASILITGSGWTLHRVAGIGDGGLAAFVKNGFVGVNSVRMFTYLGRDAAGNQGIYMARLSFFSAAPPRPVFRPVAEPALIAAQGSALNLAGGSSLGVVQDIDIADSPNIGGDVVFWVQTDDQNQSIVKMPRCRFSDYQDQVHSTYINQYDAGNASQPFPVGLPRDKFNQRGGNACGASSLTMLLNSVLHVVSGDQANRQDLTDVYRDTVRYRPIFDWRQNLFFSTPALAVAARLGFPRAKVISGKTAIDAQLANYVAVVASTRFGGGLGWGGGHMVLLLSRTPPDATGQGGFYVVDDPAGYVTPDPYPGAFQHGYYGPGNCGEHVIYPESLVAQALLTDKGEPRWAMVVYPAAGADPDVMVVSGMFTGPDPRPFQLWLKDSAGRTAGWLPGGQSSEEIPGSAANISAVVASDPSSLPGDSPDEATWPYAVSVSSPEPGLQVFVYGNLQADYSLESLLFTAGGVIRSVTNGTVAQGETQQVTLAAPALFNLTLGASAGGSVSASPTTGPYPDGAQVVVTATPDADHVFASWTVDGTPGYLAPSLTIYMDADHTATAGFAAAVLQSLALTPASPSLAVSATQQFVATGTYSDGSTQDLTAAVAWSTTAPAVATVSPAGLATAQQVGQTTISATLAGITGTTTLTVTAPPVLQSINITPANPTIAAGTARQFTATGTLTDGTTQNLTATASWSSTSPAVAAVGATGIAAATSPGSTTITATAAGISGSTSVIVISTPVLQALEVIPVAAGVQQFQAIGTYSNGRSYDITASADWSTSDPAVATISAAGLATEVQAGSVTINAASAGVSGSTSLEVTPPVLQAIVVSPVSPSITAGTALQLTATGTLSDGSTQDLTAIASWSSSNPATSTIGATGMANGLQPGTTVITAANGGISGSVGLTVVAAPSLQAIVVSPVSPSIISGTALQLTATGTLSDGSTQDLTATASWSSSNPATATISATGIATALEPGVTVITAATGGISGSTSLTVAPVPSLRAIAVTPARPGIAAGGAVQFTATGVYSDGSTRDLTSAASWFSGTTAVAIIDAAGVATGVEGGITTITATAGGFSGSTSLTVTAVPVLRSIAVTPADPSIATGATAQFTAAGTYTDGSTQDVTSAVTWSSTDVTIATVSAGGLGTAVAQGAVSITAAAGTISGSASLTVTPPLTTVTWVGTVSGSWHDPANWSTGQLPGQFNDVVINAAAGIVVTYSQGTSSVHSLTSHNDLTLTGGTLALSASSAISGALTLADTGGLASGDDVLVQGLFTCAGGQLGGPGTVTAAGRLALTASSSGEGPAITGCTLVNAGAATWTSGDIMLYAGGGIVNGPAAVFDVQFAGTMINQSGGQDVVVFRNAGRFRVSAGAGTVLLQEVALDNDGTIELASGTLNLYGLLAARPGIWTGTFTGAAGTTVVFAGSYDLQAGSSLTGPAVVFASEFGPVNIAGSYDVTGSTSTPGAPAQPMVNFTAGATLISTGVVSVDYGVINFSTGQPVTLPGSLTLADTGGLAGSDDVLVQGLFTCAGGQLGGPGTVTAAGRLALTASSFGEGPAITGCTLVNAGAATWTSGAIGLGTGGVIVNSPGAVFDVQFGGSVLNQGEGFPVFRNAGMLRVSAGTGTVSLQTVALDNAGTIDLASGTLTLGSDPRRPGSWTGAFTGAAGTTLVFAGPYDLQAGSSLTGAAVVFSSQGPVNISGSYDVTGATSTTLPASPAVNFTAGAAVTSTGAVTIDSGVINFSTGKPVTLPGSLTLADYGGLAGGDDVLVAGLFTSTSGQLAGPGTVTAAGGLAITQSPSGGAQLLITGCTLVNAGAATWTGGAINVDNGAVFRNAATATFDVTCDFLFVRCGQTTPDGICQPTGSQPVFENFGTFTKSAGTGITDFSGNPYSNGGDVAFINAGTVEAQSGHIAFGQTYTQTAGSLRLTGGNISALGTLDIQGGALSGTGTVTANVQNAGALDMGGNVGILTITGSYTQLPAGQLTARLGGLSAGTQYDQLNVAGAASLDGTLALVLAGGFTPATGDTFTVLTYASETGSVTVDGVGQSYTASYEATGLAIVFN